MKRIACVGAVVCVLTCGVAGRQPATTAPQATTDTGVVEGVRDVPSGVTIFRVIPYAAPPAGQWRWRPPQPVAMWSGIRQATGYGAICPQGIGAGSDDCLFLNVWTPGIGARAQTDGSARSALLRS
jgi:para-nitrobenzyl esterase